MNERRAFKFGPVERHGFLGPVRGGQAALVLAGAIAGLAILGVSHSPGSAAGAIAIFVLSVALATTPFAGRTLDQWLPVVGVWVLRRLVGAHEFRSAVPTEGRKLALHSDGGTYDGDLTLPRALTGVRIIALPYRRRTVGAVSERSGRWVTAVLACRVVSFSLLDAATQERGLSHWGTVLSGCADTLVRRIQWLERTAPVEGDALARWLYAEKDPQLPARGAPIVDSYLELIERAAGVSQEHEVLIAVQVDSARVRPRGRDALAATLIEETERVADGLRRVGVRIQGALTAGHLALLFRTAFDPYARADFRVTTNGNHGGLMVAEQSAWPVGAVEGWHHYRTDGAVHSTYWIAGWPRVDVGGQFLDPLLSQTSVVRTVAVTFQPMSPDRSIREVETQVTRDQADQVLRARFGQADTARQQQAYGATRRREAELAAGYNELRFGGFVTVSAPDLEQLHNARAEVKRDAVRSRLELQTMYGQQADAFTFTLPLCRGLR